MNIILAIGIRNLLRQKRRNILLGTGIAFGMMILVLSSAFSEGLSDVLFNKIIVHFSGHIQVVANEVDKKPIAIIRDRNRIEEIIRKNVSGLKDIWEDVLSFARIQGNGKSEFSIVVGMKPVPASFEGTQFVEGGIEEFSNGRFTCPIIMYKNTATSLRLKLHDTIRLRLETTSGQIQTATGIIVGIAKSDSMFDAMTMYMPIELLKTLMGFKP